MLYTGATLGPPQKKQLICYHLVSCNHSLGSTTHRACTALNIRTQSKPCALLHPRRGSTCPLSSTCCHHHRAQQHQRSSDTEGAALWYCRLTVARSGRQGGALRHANSNHRRLQSWRASAENSHHQASRMPYVVIRWRSRFYHSSTLMILFPQWGQFIGKQPITSQNTPASSDQVRSGFLRIALAIAVATDCSSSILLTTGRSWSFNSLRSFSVRTIRPHLESSSYTGDGRS